MHKITVFLLSKNTFYLTHFNLLHLIIDYISEKSRNFPFRKQLSPYPQLKLRTIRVPNIVHDAVMNIWGQTPVGFIQTLSLISYVMLSKPFNLTFSHP